MLPSKGIILPSLAHDDQTHRAFETALRMLARTIRHDNVVGYLELPPMT